MKPNEVKPFFDPKKGWRAIGLIFVLAITIFVFRFRFPFYEGDVNNNNNNPKPAYVPTKAYHVIKPDFERLVMRPGDGYVIEFSDTSWSGLIDAGTRYPFSWYLPLTNRLAELRFEGDPNPIELPAYAKVPLGDRQGLFRIRFPQGKGKALVRVNSQNYWEYYEF